MNKEELLAMRAGAELDEIVLKEVLGCNVRREKMGWNSDGGPEWCFCKCNHLEHRDWEHHHNASISPSTDISAAWQVLEKIGGAWDIRTRYRPHPNDAAGSAGKRTYHAEVQTSDYDEVEDAFYNVKSYKSPWCWSLPEAICRAALLTKLEEKINI